ncbi:glycosyltransferase [bacterium]|nr:glycosyltransferase [bacterium]
MILAFVSIKPVKKYRDKYTSKDSNLCVVVYATGEVPMLENLIKQLKNQDFDHDRYSIHIVLDKVENPPEILFQAELGVNVINVNNLEPIGKSQAYSILAEKLCEAPNLDAFVFLDSKNYVDSNFLSTINFYLTKHDVFMPEINYIGEYKDQKFWDCVRMTYVRYISKFVYSTRTRMGLTNLINTDAFAIRKDVLNQIGSFDFKDKSSELTYTMKLAQEGYQTAFVEDLKNISGCP